MVGSIVVVPIFFDDMRIPFEQAIWRFPEIKVPLNHPFLDGIFPFKLINHPAMGVPP